MFSNYIAKIEKKSKNEQIIHLDNGEKIELNNDLLFKYKLRVGYETSKKFLTEIIYENNLIKSKQKAYLYATYKPRTSQEISMKLKSEGFDEEVIEKAVIFLQKNGVVDDKEFIKLYVREKFKLKRWAYFRLKAELEKKGIRKEDFESQYYGMFSDEEIYKNGLALASKKYKVLKDKKSYKSKKNIRDMLMRAGYEDRFIKMILGALFEHDQ